MTLDVDGVRVDPARVMTYKGVMCSDIPNLAFSMGYINASWTLRADLISVYVCRLLNHMRDGSYEYCVPRRDPSVPEEPLIDFSSGYVQRSIDLFPKQGSRQPWRLHQNYARDILLLRYGAIEDEALEFAAA
jgi:cation diffusion facilitator CzcD-associated flavoprotein CzcO